MTVLQLFNPNNFSIKTASEASREETGEKVIRRNGNLVSRFSLFPVPGNKVGKPL